MSYPQCDISKIKSILKYIEQGIDVTDTLSFAFQTKPDLLREHSSGRDAKKHFDQEGERGTSVDEHLLLKTTCYRLAVVMIVAAIVTYCENDAEQEGRYHDRWSLPMDSTRSLIY